MKPAGKRQNRRSVRKGQHIRLHADADRGQKRQRAVIFAGEQRDDAIFRIIFRLNRNGKAAAVGGDRDRSHISVSESVHQRLYIIFRAGKAYNLVAVQTAVQIDGNQSALYAAHRIGITACRVVGYDFKAAGVNLSDDERFVGKPGVKRQQGGRGTIGTDTGSNMQKSDAAGRSVADIGMAYKRGQRYR